MTLVEVLRDNIPMVKQDWVAKSSLALRIVFEDR